MSTEKTPWGLSNNQLKIIAMVAMLIDHIGVSLLPQVELLRIIGRLAMPIFAYMIAEGCRYTRSRGKYLASIGILAILCQLVYFFVMGSLQMSILVTFSLSILTIHALDWFREKPGILPALAVLAVTTVVILCHDYLPRQLSQYDFALDYGGFGVLLPVAIFAFRNKWQKLLATAVMLVLLSLSYPGVQWYSLLSLPLLALYNGQRGKWKMKYVFYIFYPLHLVVIYLIGLFL